MKKALLVLGLVALLEGVVTGIIPLTRGHLFAALDVKTAAIYTALLFYFLNNFVFDLIQAIKPYVVTRIAGKARTKRTEEIVDGEINTSVSNIPQRIQEDIKLSYTCRYTVYTEYAISSIIFIQVLLMNLDYPLLIAGALCYAMISILIAKKFNSKLTLAEKSVQDREATFRKSLTLQVNKWLLRSTNATVFKAAMIRTNYTLFTKIQLGLLEVLPFIVLVPGLIAGHIGLGELMQHQATFSLLVVNAAILIFYYPQLIQGKASEDRVQELLSKRGN